MLLLSHRTVICHFCTITTPTFAFVGIADLCKRLVKRTAAQEKVLIMLAVFIFPSCSFCYVMIQKIQLTKALRFIQEFDDIFYIFILSSILFYVRARPLV